MFAPGAPAETPATADQARFDAMIHDYLVRNPNVVMEALQAYQAQQQKERDKAGQEALVARGAELFNDPKAPVIGDPDGDVTLVEFFDYQCHFCKGMQPDLVRLLKDDKHVRVVMKEFPILGPDSVTASKAALASVQQGRYAEFHEALMANPGKLDADTIDRIAKGIGIDVGRLHLDMQKPDIDQALNANRALGQALQISGTPSFVALSSITQSALHYDQLNKLVEDARLKKGK